MVDSRADHRDGLNTNYSKWVRKGTNKKLKNHLVSPPKEKFTLVWKEKASVDEGLTTVDLVTESG